MKKLVYFILFISASLMSKAVSENFKYDKDALNAEFLDLDKVAIYVEETNVSYCELSSNPEFKGKNLTNHINLKPTLSIDDVDWGAFAWGFCCWPVGIFTVLINDEKDQNSKNSFWAGVGTAAITYVVSYVGIYALLIASLGGGW